MLPKFEDKKARVFYAIIILLVVLFVYLVVMLGHRTRTGQGVKDAVEEDIGVAMTFPDGTVRELEDSKLKTYRDEDNARRYRTARDRNISGMWADIADDGKRQNDGGDADVYGSIFGKDDRELSDEELIRKYYPESYIDPQEAKGLNKTPRGSGGGGIGGGASTVREAPAKAEAEPAPEAPAETVPEPVQESRGVVHSMREEMRAGRTAGSSQRTERARKAVENSGSPVRCQFVRDEEIATGKRVTVRLLDPLHLEGGVVVPANTRISATCMVGDRLMMNFAGLSMNGMIYSLNYTAYDSDGLPGLYCAGGEGGIGSQAKREAVDEGIGIAESVVSGSGVVGRLAGGALRIGRLASQSSGSGSSKVQVPSGYIFYIMENTKN